MKMPFAIERLALAAALSLVSAAYPVFAAPVLSHLDLTSATPVSGEIYQLPGYGAVQVNVSNNPMIYGKGHITPAENQTLPSGHTWGTDTDILTVTNAAPGVAGFLDYTISFNFLGGIPDWNRLYFVTAGLAAGTTISVSETSAKIGEVHFVTSQGTNPSALTSTTNLAGSILTSAANSNTSNTGWALFGFQNALTSNALTFTAHQLRGDGLGYNLAYAQNDNPAPAPATVPLMGLGLLGVCFAKRKANQSLRKA
jgi:PEP-CTERM motif